MSVWLLLKLENTVDPKLAKAGLRFFGIPQMELGRFLSVEVCPQS